MVNDSSFDAQTGWILSALFRIHLDYIRQDGTK